MNFPLVLHSDFHDYYDYMFASKYTAGKVRVFERLSTGGPSRKEMFRILVEAGYTVPPHCDVTRLCSVPDPPAQVVVYLDERAHRGAGKLLLPTQDALASYPEYFSSAYIQPRIYGTSIRLLRIGRQSWWLRYTSKDDWRSNVGDGDITLVHNCKYHTDVFIRNPLFAIDFVETYSGLYAIDFNIAPQIRGTGLEKYISASDIVQEIYRSLEENCSS